MSTRSKSDKAEIDDVYKTAIGSQNKSKPHASSTIYTSTPTGIPTSTPTPWQIEFSLDYTLIAKDKIEGIIDTSAPASSDSTDLMIRSACKSDTFSDKNISGADTNTMVHSNPFATLKYAVETVPFFDDQNISLSYFIERCEEAKFILIPEEAEPQFTKIIRTRIVGGA